jgi:hypothetical protein
VVGTDASANLGPDRTPLGSRPTLAAGTLPLNAGPPRVIGQVSAGTAAVFGVAVFDEGDAVRSPQPLQPKELKAISEERIKIARARFPRLRRRATG